MRMLRIILILFLVVGASGPSLAEEKHETLLVDRFWEGLNNEGIPKGWTLEKSPSKESKISIEQDKEGPFLRILSVDDTFGVKKEMSFEIPAIRGMLIDRKETAILLSGRRL
jgi:hypothetical protein